MLGFIISTLAFSLAAYALNRYFDSKNPAIKNSRKWHVLIAATAFSMGVGWLVDNIDGDSKLPAVSMADTLRSGDPIKIAKLLAGIN